MINNFHDENFRIWEQGNWHQMGGLVGRNEIITQAEVLLKRTLARRSEKKFDADWFT